MYRILLAIFPLIFLTCDLPHKLGPQPTEIIPTEFEPGHNILGILRLDDVANSSFIRVERAYQTEELSNTFSVLIENATVTIAQDSNNYTFAPVTDSIRGFIYTNDQFKPIVGKQYFLSIKSPDLPDVTADTKIPSRPIVIDSSINVTEKQIKFTIKLSSDIKLYEVFILSETDDISRRLSNDDKDLLIEINLSKLNGTPKLIEVYGYESNLAKYLSSSFTIKPQTFHEIVSTVNDGYGCFGALSKTTVNLN